MAFHQQFHTQFLPTGRITHADPDVYANTGEALTVLTSWDWWDLELYIAHFTGANAQAMLNQLLPKVAEVKNELDTVKTKVDALGPQLTQAETEILAAIQAGGAVDLSGVVVAINNVANVLGSDGTQVVERLTAIADQIAVGIVNELGAIDSTLLRAGDRVGTAVGDALATFVTNLTPLLSALTNNLIGDKAAVERVLDGVEAGTEGPWPAVLPFIMRMLAPVLIAAVYAYLPQIVTEVEVHAPGLRDRLNSLGATVGEGLADGVARLHGPLRGTMEGLAQLFFNQLDTELGALGEASEGNVLPVAASLLATAGSLGMTSHLVASAAEMLAPTKHLGLNQFAAFLTDLAGFRVIAQNSFGVQFEVALREPARRRANERFRPSVPDVGRFEELFLKGLASSGEAETYFARLGWPDHFVTRYLDAVYREPRARELSLILEDGELDEAWVMDKLRRGGFREFDAQRLLEGLRTRAHKTARLEAVRAFEEAFVDGLLDEGTLLGNLRALRFDDESVELLRLSAGYKRLKKENDALRAALLREVELGQLDPDDLRAALAALGYDERAAAVYGQIGRIRVGARFFAQEQADQRAAVRRVQATEIQAELELYRHFLISEGQLAVALRAVGVLPEEADALVALAAARRTPAPRLAEVLTPEAQVQEAMRIEAKAVLELQRKGLLSEVEAASQLRALGIPGDVAGADARVVAASLVRPVLPPAPPTPTEAEAARQVAARDAALARFRNGLTSQTALLQELLAAGVVPAAAQALVQGEVARHIGQLQREDETVIAREAHEARTALERAAVEAFRAGRLDAEGLRQNLIGIGLLPSTADAIVTREEELQKTREARETEETTQVGA